MERPGSIWVGRETVHPSIYLGYRTELSQIQCATEEDLMIVKQIDEITFKIVFFFLSFLAKSCFTCFEGSRADYWG
jgi:hypothetical protein